MPKLAWNKLGAYLRETQLLGSIHSTLYWDQNTTMPLSGSAWRGEQLTYLASNLHSRNTSCQFEDLLQEARQELEENMLAKELGDIEVSEKIRNLELLEQDFNRQKKLDPKLVSDIATAQVEGYNSWQQARLNNDFVSFAPFLRRLIFLRQEQSKQLDEARGCWETLAQPYEPDLTKTRLDELFLPLRRRLPEMLESLKPYSSGSSYEWDLDEKSQKILCDQLLMEWGRDEKITSIGRSPHPFSITLGPNDFRLTTRVVKGQPLSCLLATAHEWGHSLYEQGLPAETHQWFAWPLGQATSMAMHESQSLFWENRVARSKEFTDRFWRKFKEVGAPIDSASDLWRFMNPMAPGLNRVEADELTYGLHILIRTDLEIALLENGLDVLDLPHEWNQNYKDLLGITPINDSEGCLQDVHWSEGAFGYFPSYLLGHLISAQLSEAMGASLKEEGILGKDPIGECIGNGNEDKLLSWLRKEVHHFGRRVNAEQLVEKVTGKELSSSPFLKYLEEKINILTASA